jgi:hypothetical protein
VRNSSEDPSSSSAVKNPDAKTKIEDTAPTFKDWQKYSPAGEEFSVLMPKETLTESRRSLYNGAFVNRNIYRSPIGTRPFFAIISAGGINARRSQPSDAEKLDSYVDAFRYWLPEAALGKGPAAKLTLVGEKTISGHSGREYQVAVGELSGIARAYFTGRRFYVAVMLEASQQDLRAQQFFESFALREDE